MAKVEDLSREVERGKQRIPQQLLKLVVKLTAVLCLEGHALSAEEVAIWLETVQVTDLV